MISRRFLLVAISCLACAQHVALAREPNGQERERVEHALRSLGYKEWGKINLDEDVWFIEEVIDADGKEWEIELDAVDLRVLSKEPG